MELDISPLLNDDDAQLFASYIGILQWAVELGQIDLTQAVLLMARFHNAPCKGHMEAVLCIFSYIKGHLNSKVVFDLAYHNWMHINWHDDAEWKDFYPDMAEPMPPHAPEPRERKCRSISILMLPMQLVWQQGGPQLVS